MPQSLAHAKQVVEQAHGTDAGLKHTNSNASCARTQYSVALLHSHMPSLLVSYVRCPLQRRVLRVETVVVMKQRK